MKEYWKICVCMYMSCSFRCRLLHCIHIAWLHTLNNRFVVQWRLATSLHSQFGILWESTSSCVIAFQWKVRVAQLPSYLLHSKEVVVDTSLYPGLSSPFSDPRAYESIVTKIVHHHHPRCLPPLRRGWCPSQKWYFSLRFLPCLIRLNQWIWPWWLPMWVKARRKSR